MVVEVVTPRSTSMALRCCLLLAFVPRTAPLPTHVSPPRLNARAASPRLSLAVGTLPVAERPAYEQATLLAEQLRAQLEIAPNSTAPASDFIEVIRAFAEIGCPDDCRQWLRQMRRRHMALPLEAYALVVAALIAAGRQREAQRWLRRVVTPEVQQSMLSREAAAKPEAPPTLERYNRAMATYAAAGRPTEVMTVMRQMVRDGGIAPDVVSFNSLIAAHAAAGDPQRGYAWLTRMQQWNVHPDVISFTSAIAGFSRSGEPLRARAVLLEMQAAGVRPNVRSYSALVEAFSAAGLVDEAAAWLARAREAGVTPNVVTYSSVAKGYALLERFGEAREVIAEMKAASVHPSRGTFQALIACSTRSGQLSEAMHWLDEMHSAGAAMDGAGGGGGKGARGGGAAAAAGPSTLAYNMVIGCLVKEGRRDEAEALLKRMCDAGVTPDTVTFSSLITPRADTSPSKAADWLEMMKQLGVKPDAVCYNKVIACYARARLPEIAEEWLDRMADAGVPPNVVSFSSAIGGYAKMGQPDEALALLRKMALFGLQPDGVALNAVIEAHINAGALEQALGLLRKMSREPGADGGASASGPSAGVKADLVSYTLVISALAKGGDFARAAEWLTRMRAAGIAADVPCYNGLIRGYAAWGKLDEAQRLLTELTQQGLQPDQWTFGPVLEACRRAGEVRLARRLGKLMLLGRAFISPFCTISLRRTIGFAQLRGLARECQRLDHPAVRQALKSGARKRTTSDEARQASP